MRLIRTLHDAIDAHLSTIADEAARHEALMYLRGLKTLLATTSSGVEFEHDSVTRMNETVSRQRVDAAIRETRHRQLAAARGCVHNDCMGEFWGTIPC